MTAVIVAKTENSRIAVNSGICVSEPRRRPITLCRAGLAIPVVLGFIMVAFLMGSTLVFMSRASVADSQRLLARLQHLHCAEMGINEALNRIKPKTLAELRQAHGPVWRFSLPERNFGKAVGWCDVAVHMRDGEGIRIVSVGKWRDQKLGTEKLRGFSCLARYREDRRLDENNRLIIIGEWKVDRFREDSGRDNDS